MPTPPETHLLSPAQPSTTWWSLIALTARYVVSGVACMVIEQGVVWMMKRELQSSDEAAIAVAIVGSVGLNYALNVGWVFEHRAITRRSLEMLLFAGIMAVGLAINLGVSLWVSPPLQAWCGPLGLNLAKAIGSLAAGGWGFTSKKIWLFPDRSQPAVTEAAASVAEPLAPPAGEP